MANTKITTRVLTDGAITSAKLADDAVSIAKLDVTDGTNGQVLKTDGNGTLTFTDMTADTDTTYSAGTGLSLTGTTFSSTITQYADSDARSALSAGTGISYNSSTGVISAPTHTSHLTNNSNFAVTGASASFTTLSTTNASNSGGVARNVYQSTSAPSSGDGAVGDLWVLYS